MHKTYCNSFYKIVSFVLILVLSVSFLPVNFSYAEASNNPIKISWQLYSEQPKDMSLVSKKLNEYLKQKFNIEVNFIFTSNASQPSSTFNDDISKYDNVIATLNKTQYSALLNQGKLLTLDNYIDKYAPKTKQILGDKILSLATEGSSIFGLPIPGSDFAHASGIAVNKEIVDKLKISLAKIKKLSDIETILAKIKTANSDTIPLINNVSGIDYNLLGLESIGGYLGSVKIGSNTSTIINEYSTTEFKTYYQNLNSFVKQSYLKKYDKITNPLADKKVFAVLSDRLSPLNGDSIKDLNRLNLYLGKPIITEEDVKNNLISIRSDSKNPDSCLKLIELFNTDSYITNLLHFGIANKHYVLNSNKTISYPNGVTFKNTTYPQTLQSLLCNRFLDYVWANEDSTIYKKLKDFTDKANVSLTKNFVFDSMKVAEDFKKCSYLIYNRIYAPNLQTDKNIMFGSENPISFIPALINDLSDSDIKNVIDQKQTQLNNLFNLTITTPVSSFNLSNSANSISIIANNDTVFFPTPPIFDGTTIWAYAKPILDNLGLTYTYNSKNKSLTIYKDTSSLTCTADNKSISIDKKTKSLTFSPRIVNNQFFIPVKEILNELSIKSTLNKTQKEFLISYDVKTEFTGNNVNNLSGYSSITGSKDSIFTCINNKELYRISKSDNSKKKLLTENCEYINVKDNDLFFVSYNNKNNVSTADIVTCKTDGSARKVLVKGTNSISNLQLVDNFLYYIDQSNNLSYKLSLDGKNVSKISNIPMSFLMIEKGWMYFVYNNSQTLAKVKLSGAGLKVLATNISPNITNLNLSNGWIYYLGADDSKPQNENMFTEEASSIYKIKLDGSQKSLVIPANYAVFLCQGNLIYYNDEMGNLYSYDEVTKLVTKITSNVGAGILNYHDGWIYIYSLVESDLTATIQIYRVKLDGSIKQKFSSTGSLINVYVKGELENIGQPMPVIIPETTPATDIKTIKEITKNTKGVVYIKIFDEEGTQLASGSGFCITPDGIIATNYHVIDGAYSIRCSFDDGRSYDVKYILNFDKKKDIALLQLKDSTNLPILSIGNSNKIELGDDVVAIGNPMELQNTVSSGIISGVRKILGLNYLQTTASISPGSSGGPLFNSYGEVIGITSMTFRDSQNLNFAIPVNELKNLFSTSRIISFNEANNMDTSISEIESNNTVSTANQFEPGFDISANFSNDNDIDFYKFELKTKSQITFFGSFNSSNNNPKILKELSITLLDSKGNEIAKSSISSQELYDVQKISKDLDIGTYYLKVSKINVDSELPDVKTYNVISVLN